MNCVWGAQCRAEEPRLWGLRCWRPPPGRGEGGAQTAPEGVFCWGRFRGATRGFDVAVWGVLPCPSHLLETRRSAGWQALKDAVRTRKWPRRTALADPGGAEGLAARSSEGHSWRILRWECSLPPSAPPSRTSRRTLPPSTGCRSHHPVSGFEQP